MASSTKAGSSLSENMTIGRGALDDSARTPSSASRSGGALSMMTRLGASLRTASTRSAPPAARDACQKPAPTSARLSDRERSRSESLRRIRSDMIDRSLGRRERSTGRPRPRLVDCGALARGGKTP